MPPKDPCIKVRVLEEIGSVMLSDHSANLARHAILFLRRTDAERYISEVFLSIFQSFVAFGFAFCCFGIDYPIATRNSNN